MIIGLGGFVTSSLNRGWKNEVIYFLIHVCKDRELFRIWDVGFRILLTISVIKKCFMRGVACGPGYPGLRSASALLRRAKPLLSLTHFV